MYHLLQKLVEGIGLKFNYTTTSKATMDKESTMLNSELSKISFLVAQEFYQVILLQSGHILKQVQCIYHPLKYFTK